MAAVNRQNNLASIVILLMMYSLSVGMAHAQNTSQQFVNHKLEGIASNLASLYRFQCNVPQTYLLKSLCAHKPIIVSVDPFNVVNHIGIKLFDRAITEANPSPTYHFVERFLLELLLINNDAEINKYLFESKVVLRGEGWKQQDIVKGLLRTLAQMTTDQSIIITTDNNRYTVSWFRQGRLLFSIRFPIQYELLWGMNKTEAENKFYLDVLTSTKNKRSKRVLDNPSSESLTPIGDSCYCASGDSYAIDAVTSNRYYQRQADKSFKPLFDALHPIESIYNLFTIEANPHIEAQITQKMYGGRKNEFNLPLLTLVDFCKTSGCEAYVGIQSKEGNRLCGVVMMVNRALGYNHLLHFDTDLRILIQPQQYRMNIQLYAFVPMHNITNLYNDQPNNQLK